ncbi:MAG: methionyl-tRNA formyltransferase [Candidatus Limnocylindrus sp.]
MIHQRQPSLHSAARCCEGIVTSSRLILFGSGGFAVPSFRAIATDPRFEIVAVVTAPPRAAGRGGAPSPTPVDSWASSAGLQVAHVAKVRDAAEVARIQRFGAEGALLADFGQIIPKVLLDHYPRGIVNLHPSLLPRHRGSSPIPATILAGDRETGVSTIVMDQGVDTGPIIAVQHLRPRLDITASELEEELAELAAVGIADRLAAWLQGSGSAVPQSVEGATLSTRLSRADGRVGAQTPCETALRMWRAYQPWPGVWIEIPGIVERLILSSVSLAEVGPTVAPGDLELRDGALLLGLPGGAIRLDRVIPAGGKSMSGAEFARGRQAELATRGRIAE